MATITVLVPTCPQPAPPAVTRAPRAHPVAAGALTIVNNGKPGARAFLGLVARQLAGHVGERAVEVHDKPGAAKPITSEQAERLAAGSALALTGLGDCGACSACSVNDAIQLERLGVPTVAVITEPFQALASGFAVKLGLPDVAMAVVPHQVASRDARHLAALAERIAGSVAEQLTGTRPG